MPSTGDWNPRACAEKGDRLFRIQHAPTLLKLPEPVRFRKSTSLWKRSRLARKLMNRFGKTTSLNKPFENGSNAA